MSGTQHSWLTPTLATHATQSIVDNGTIPDFITYYSPFAASSLRNIQEVEIIPENSMTLYKQKGLQTREAEMIRRRLYRFNNINLIDLAETTGDSPLPFILETLESEQLDKYMVVTANPAINEMAANRLKGFVMNSGRMPKFEARQFVCEIELNPFDHLIAEALKDDDYNSTANLYLLMNSRLGNSSNPEKFLTNIYRSMQSGDYIAIAQALYKSGTEDDIAKDYMNLVSRPDCFMGLKSLGAILDPEGEIETYWSETEEFTGVRIGININRVGVFNGLDLAQNDSISLMQTARFKPESLLQLVQRVGFNIIEISMDEDEENAIFFLVKN